MWCVNRRLWPADNINDVEERRGDAEKDEPARAVSVAEAPLREDGGSSKL